MSSQSEASKAAVYKVDWRTNNVTTLTTLYTPPGSSQSFPPGSTASQAGVIPFGNDQIGIVIPNATALFLGLSQQYHVEAEHWIGKRIQLKSIKHLNEADTFCFFERMMAAVVFACTALEAFVNEEIPETYVHKISEKANTRHYNKEQIERHLNLDAKVGDVLPVALNVASPKGGSLWNSYVRLQEIRDRVIHMKAKDREYRGLHENSIWAALMSDPLPETYRTAKNTMEYFLRTKPTQPRWFKECPF